MSSGAQPAPCSLWSAWNDLFERTGSTRAIAVLRILVGPIVIVHLWPFLEQAQSGLYFADAFFVPFFDWWPVLNVGVYRALIWLAIASSVAMSLGLGTRLACAYTFFFVSFNVLSNQLFFHHNRAFLMSILFGLALIPCGATLSIDAWLAARRGRPLADAMPLWRLYLVRCLACTPYLASGASKLIDPAWWGGVVMYDRLLRFRHIAEQKGVPSELIDIIAVPEFHAVFWKFVVLTELFIGIGYWFGRTRVGAMYMALGFHVLIEITSRVSVFSYLGICATLIWVVPQTRDRIVYLRLDTPGGRRWVRVIQALDWLARFDIRPQQAPASANEKRKKIEWVVDDRSGRIEGAAARRVLLSRLPIFMPLVAPWLLLSEHRRSRRASTDAPLADTTARISQR